MTSARAIAPAVTSVVGWRAFALHRGQLAAPFQLRYWPNASERLTWSAGMNHAECLDRPGCRTPAEDCTCGFRATENLYYLRQSLQQPFQGSEVSILEECGILARVRLSGRILHGVDIGTDDPETTWRASQAEIIELHLAPRHEPAARGLKMNYEVPVAVYETDDEWLHSVAPIDPMGPKRPTSDVAFCNALTGLSFGGLSLNGLFHLAVSRQPAADVVMDLLATGHQAAEGLAGESPAPDIARALWDHHPLKPSMAEATAFVEAVIAHLYPYNPDTVRRVAIFTRPPTLQDELNREARSAIRGVGSSVKALMSL